MIRSQRIMKTDKYIVVELSIMYPLASERTWEFSRAEHVGSFMWGRYCGKHLIYKNGILAHLSHLEGDVKSLVEYLEGL